jgi:hypothetical protein
MAQDLDSAKEFLKRQKGKPWGGPAAPPAAPVGPAAQPKRDPLLTGEKSASGVADNLKRRKAMTGTAPVSKPVARKVASGR